MPSSPKSTFKVYALLSKRSPRHDAFSVTLDGDIIDIIAAADLPRRKRTSRAVKNAFNRARREIASYMMPQHQEEEQLSVTARTNLGVGVKRLGVTDTDTRRPRRPFDEPIFVTAVA